MDSRSRRELIDRIRREKFGIGATRSNPLAGMLHEAIVSLSAELYQKDIHFISELLQNAEDNVYAKGVTPSLELVLTRTDITGVGAPATLILFNNEVGFQPQHVEALCAVGMSTKKGKRNSGYIGEKGIGFKSVFLVTRTPYVISNGYRFRFTDEASNEAKIGYVVPEWVEEPTDADMKRVYGKSELPQTMIILPLRRDKVEPVREQLKQVAPETLLFLSKLRQVNVRQDTSGQNLCIIRSDLLPPTNEVSTVNLSVGSHVNHIQEESKYFLLQQKFPVTQRVGQRMEVDNWVITVAFPLRNRINPGQLIGDIFAFLPSSLASGFPFVVNADFLLVSSRETLKFDSPWNIGILSCIPAVFRMAFNFFLQKISPSTFETQMAAPVLAIRDAYQFVPVGHPQQPEFKKVQQHIMDDLKADDCVLVDTLAGGNQFCKPKQARFITKEFRKILDDANDEGHISIKSSPAIRNSPWRIVDGQIQKVHASTLKMLGVTDMTEKEYIEYLKHGDWILSLSERLYCDVISFVLNSCHSSGSIKKLPILKYCIEDGSIALASIQQARFIKTEFRKILDDANDEGHISFKSSPAIRNSPWRIVDGQIQKVHASTLKMLGVTDMTEKEYIEYLKHGDWILSLSERLYCDVISFVLNSCHSSGSIKKLPILKYCKEDGSIALASIQQARFIKTEFRKILDDANDEGNISFKSSPAIRNSPWRIVDRQIQKVHASTLKMLGITDMAEAEYIEYLKHEDWILSLSERLYCDVISFVLNFCCFSGRMKAVPILKYCKEDGSIALASVQQALDKDVEIYMSPSEQGKRLNTEWALAFKPWVSVVFMPTSTVQTLKRLRQQGSHSICRISHYLDRVVSDLSVKSYLQRLLALLGTAEDPKFVLLVTEFMYQCLQGKDIEKRDCSLNPVIVVDQYSRVCKPGRSSNILLPAHGSTWPVLKLSSWSSSTIVLSDDYVITPPAWHSSLKACISDKADLFVLQPYRSYLEDVLSASDIPHMVPVADSPYEMPVHLRLTMTIERANLLLKWLTNCLNSQSALAVSQSRFINNMKNSEWLPTEEHGLRRPSLCFDRSSFRAFFESSDVPCIHPSLSSFSPALQGLGVVTDNKKGCDAVINYMLEMCNDSTSGNSCSIGQATRFYRYFHKFHLTNSLPTSVNKLKIFVPRTSQHNTSSHWKDRESCVIRDVEGYFGDILTVLECWYPLDLLPFFRRDLHVSDVATVEKYCQLWLTWRVNVHEITEHECTCVWKMLSEKWTKCDVNTRVEFTSKAWVPSFSEITGTIQLSSPADSFIPDNLHLLSLFAGQPGVHFVWYPNNTEKMESGMNRVYADMKVKNLSLCVQQEFIIGGDSAGDYYIQNQQAVAGKGILCAGLFRAILGFLARKKYGLPSSERQNILTSLKSVQEITITGPLTSSWTISSLSPPVVATEDNVMALWSTKDRKFYCLDKENPILRNCLARRHFRTQVSTAISSGLLSEHPSVADELTEFINVLIGSGFETSHVEYELRRKNAKLFEEDELFLSQLQT